jgi:hypothetical protein
MYPLDPTSLDKTRQKFGFPIKNVKFGETSSRIPLKQTYRSKPTQPNRWLQNREQSKLIEHISQANLFYFY